MRSMIRQNATLQARLGEAVSRRTGIPVDDLIVRYPSPTHGKPVKLVNDGGKRCEVFERWFNYLEPMKQVIAQAKSNPVHTLQRLTICLRSDRCARRFEKAVAE